MKSFFSLIDCSDERRAVAEANRRTEAANRENAELRRRAEAAYRRKEAIERENAELRRRLAELEQRHNGQNNP